jgi:hypothetical protein
MVEAIVMADFNRVLGHGLGFVGQLVQGRTQEAFDSLSPAASGSVLDASLDVSETRVPHKLGKQIQGWYIVDVDAPVTIHRSGDFDDKFIGLTASGPCNVKVFVF